MKYVNQPVPKTDAMALVTGKPVYTDDLAPKDCLIVQDLKKSPCKCLGGGDKDRKCCKGSGNCLHPYLAGCASEAFYPGRTDLSGDEPG